MPSVGSLFERFTTPHSPGALLGSLNPRWGTRFPDGRARGVISSISPTGSNAALITILPPLAWPEHRPGQFVAIGVEIDGVIETRCFTITSVPRSVRKAQAHHASGGGPSAISERISLGASSESRAIEIAVQASDSGLVSKHLVNAARVGDHLLLGHPEGDFTLESVPSGDLLFLTGGSGITPAMAMLRALAAEGVEPPRLLGGNVVVIHHVRSRDALLFDGELESMAAELPWLRVEVIETRLRDGEPNPEARISMDRLNAHCADWNHRRTFLCGPKALMDDGIDLWADAGAADNMRVEVFQSVHGAVAGESLANSAAGSVLFARSGVAVESDGNTVLLELAEQAGLAPKSGCRMGICHTCVTQVHSGNTIDLRNGSISTAGDRVQICVSCPVDEVTLDL